MKPNDCNFMGRLVADPDFKYSPNGLAICNFSIACSESYIAKDKTVKESVTYPKLVSFGRLAERINQLKKGDQVSVNCTYQVRTSGEDKEKKYYHSFTVRDISKTEFLKNPEAGAIQNGAQPDGNFAHDNIPF